MLSDVLHIISGPVIGAVIGAFTNYIAIKMLFRPLKPVYIGRFRLPLTPGIIPKRQEKLADALSDTVYKNFFTNSDIEGIFMSDEMAERFAAGITNRLSELGAEDLGSVLDEETVWNLKKMIYLKIHTAIFSSDLVSIVEQEARKLMDSSDISGLIGLFLQKDELAEKIAHQAGDQLTDYLMNHDLELIMPILDGLEADLRSMDLASAASDAGIHQDVIKGLVKSAYLRFMKNAKSAIAEGFHMKQFIYNKIMELDPGEIERHVNGAIKREMNYLVYLGGFLGLLIGIINIFV